MTPADRESRSPIQLILGRSAGKMDIQVQTMQLDLMLMVRHTGAAHRSSRPPFGSASPRSVPNALLLAQRAGTTAGPGITAPPALHPSGQSLLHSGLLVSTLRGMAGIPHLCLI